MIQIVNIPITRDSTDYPWEEFLKGVESGQETLNKLLDDSYTVLHSSVIKDHESQRLHFVLYKPTHLVALDREAEELDRARIKPGNNGHPPTDPDTYSDDHKHTLPITDEMKSWLAYIGTRFTLTAQGQSFLDAISDARWSVDALNQDSSAALD